MALFIDALGHLADDAYKTDDSTPPPFARVPGSAGLVQHVRTGRLIDRDTLADTLAADGVASPAALISDQTEAPGTGADSAEWRKNYRFDWTHADWGWPGPTPPAGP